ncbi:MAG: glycosyltransferase [Anaerolineae bacterium]|nr:MAG: glycosyltransferase [Anaerolineae bacterium]
MLIVDDASTQPVDAVVAGYDDARLRFVQNPSNLGLVGNWNRCIELAQGRYITIFHQDDVMHPDNLALKQAVLDDNPSVGFVYSNIERINELGEVFSGHWITQPADDVTLMGCEIFRMVAETGNPISCPSVMVRSTCYRQLGYFDNRLPFTADIEMWLRIASGSDVGYIHRPLIRQRVHTNQETNRFSGTGRDYQDVLHALSIAFGRAISPDCASHQRQAFRTLARQSRAMARWKLRQGKVRVSFRYLGVMRAVGNWQARAVNSEDTFHHQLLSAL